MSTVTKLQKRKLKSSRQPSVLQFFRSALLTKRIRKRIQLTAKWNLSTAPARKRGNCEVRNTARNNSGHPPLSYRGPNQLQPSKWTCEKTDKNRRKDLHRRRCKEGKGQRCPEWGEKVCRQLCLRFILPCRLQFSSSLAAAELHARQDESFFPDKKWSCDLKKENVRILLLLLVVQNSIIGASWFWRHQNDILVEK